MQSQRKSVTRPLPRTSFFEPLEERRLLSITLDVRLAGGGTTATVTSKGQVINMEVWATVKGQNSTATDEGLQDVFASFLSTNLSGGAALGTLAATNIAPFNQTASQPGVQQDLDQDGDLDIGNLTHPLPIGHGADPFVARSNTMTTSGGVTTTNSQSWKIANLTFTVGSLLLGSGASTQIKIVPRTAQDAVGAVWQEDGARKSAGGISGNSNITLGSVVTLKRNIGTISGKVWNDRNANGNRESTEGGLGAWRVYIDTNKNGKFDTGEISTLSSAGGNYAFTNLKAGTYRLRIIQQAGFRRTKPTGSFYDVALGVGDLQARNWGETTNTLITGIVFNDANSNKIKDSNEGVFAGWRVFADLNKNGAYDSKTDVGVLTDASGRFTIGTLGAGLYNIVASSATGYTRTVPTTGMYSVSLAAGQASSSLLFGIHKNA
jgi:hypothetical protein